MDDNPPGGNSGWPLWGKVTALLAALGVIAGGIENADKIWKKFNDLCCVDNVPHVRVTKTNSQWGSDCLQFDFSNLPTTFRLGEIRLPIENPKVGSLPGDQSAKLLEANVSTLIDDDSIIQKQAINITCRVGATQENDAFFVTYCPVLKQPGEYSTFQTKPEFFAPGEDKPISKLNIALPDKLERIEITSKHPKNLNASISPDATVDCSKVPAPGGK